MRASSFVILSTSVKTPVPKSTLDTVKISTSKMMPHVKRLCNEVVNILLDS